MPRWLATALTATAGVAASAAPPSELRAAPLPYFLRSYNATGDVHTLATSDGSPGLPAWLAGLDHYRLLPGIFPKGMEFHFDGLATVMKFSFDADASQVHYFAKPYASKAATEYKKCIFFGAERGARAGA